VVLLYCLLVTLCTPHDTPFLLSYYLLLLLLAYDALAIFVLFWTFYDFSRARSFSLSRSRYSSYIITITVVRLCNVMHYPFVVLVVAVVVHFGFTLILIPASSFLPYVIIN
jgi:hypothetical protein